jgi:hypothetical protein
MVARRAGETPAIHALTSGFPADKIGGKPFVPQASRLLREEFEMKLNLVPLGHAPFLYPRKMDLQRNVSSRTTSNGMKIAAK